MYKMEHKVQARCQLTARLNFGMLIHYDTRVPNSCFMKDSLERSIYVEQKINEIIAQMTLEEKAGLCSGADFWTTKAVERLGVPSVMVSDGPHGLRKQGDKADHLGLNSSVEAVCFPAGSALASSFDTELMAQTGEALGDEAIAEELHTLLGPAINIKRSPLCGRNFEYLSEDPYLAGKMAAGYIKAIQGKKVGVSVKHYAANNQEYERMSNNSVVDERTMREIYLTAFEIAVKESDPWSLMGAYNQVNGTYACENEWLLDRVLRQEWGYKGIVMTDWGAMNDRVKALKAGLELEMPHGSDESDNDIIKAVQNGALSEAVLDEAVRRLLYWTFRGYEGEAVPYDKEEHHNRARRVAAECAVLLKNDGILPLKKSGKVALIGAFAENPRFQGSGSSKINNFKLSSAVQAIKAINGVEATYAKGYEINGEPSEALVDEAVGAAKAADVAVIFAGLPDAYESEGFDRSHLNIPDNQNALIKAVAKAQSNVVVVLHNGSPILMPWLEDVKGVLEMYLGGQAVGEASVDLLFGDANPSGKLAETFPLRLQDTPCYLHYPGTKETAYYGEGVFVGYRYYDSREMKVLFPFGYGLSYTTFEVSGLKLSASGIKDTDTVTATVTVKNTGSRAGKEVVQFYVAPAAETAARRPMKELKGFVKVALETGEEKQVSVTLDKRSFAYFDERVGDWYVQTGCYTVLAGTSSRCLPLSAEIQVEGTTEIPFVLSETTTIGDVMRADPNAVQALMAGMAGTFSQSEMDTESISKTLGEGMAQAMTAMISGMPLHSLSGFIGVPRAELEKMIAPLVKK